MARIKSPDYHFPERSGPMELGTPFRRIVVVQAIHPSLPEKEVEEQYEEICRLVETLDGKVVGNMVQRRSKPHREYYIGQGKADKVGSLCDDTNADTVVFDAELSPKQVANLEYETGSHVMDRTELILEIFSRRAKTAEAKAQVELAYLDYTHPRMDQSTRLRAYRGGLRGHGESLLGRKLRASKEKAKRLRKKLKKLEASKETQQRNRRDMWTVALVGYTNAGKSTLLNALSGEKVYADDRLFATLDTTTRRVHLQDSRSALISDTVGFIRRLPHQLIASFRSTLSEALAADLLLHVADASSPTLEHQIKAVEQTLLELDVTHDRILLGFNKIDALNEEDLSELRMTYRDAVFFSAKEKSGLDELRSAVYDAFVHGVAVS